MPKDRAGPPENEPDIDHAILARYLSGASDAVETARVRRWLDADPAHGAEFARLEVAWNPGPPPEADQDDSMWRVIEAGMARSERGEDAVHGPKPEPRRSLAASVKIDVAWRHAT